jgi:hypothetical protein
VNTLHVEDFVVLGRTVPEESKKYGKRVCMAGYSAECNQFLRVYPLMVPVGDKVGTNDFKARHRYTLDLKRNPNDNRTESWRVHDEMAPTSTPWDKAPDLKKADVLAWLRKRAVPSIRCLDECRLSLGVICLAANQWEGITIPKDEPDPQPEHATLFDDLIEATQGSVAGFDPTKVKHAPYIRFSDRDGKHRLQVREWGALLLLGKPDYADTPNALWNANAYKSNRDIVLVVGNMNNHRNNWLIIKTFQPDEPKKGPSLFDDVSDGDTPPPAPKKKAKK